MSLIQAGEDHWRVVHDGVARWPARYARRRLALSRKLGAALHWLRKACEQLWPDEPFYYSQALSQVMQARAEIMAIAGRSGDGWGVADATRVREDRWAAPYDALRAALALIEFAASGVA